MTTEATEVQDMALIPPAVRKRIAEMSKFTTPDPNAEPKDESTAGTPPTAEPAPADVTPEPEPEPKKDEVTPPAEPQTFAEVATEEMTKEQRYKIMEGMQKAIGRDLRQARAEANALRGEVEALKAQVTARPAAPAAVSQTQAPQPLEGMDELKEAFGEKNLQDMVKFMRSQGFVVSQDLQQVNAQVGQVAQSVASSAQERFDSQMEDYTEGRWRTINTDSRFIDYMNEPEGRTGISRLEFAQRYLAEQNAPMLAQFFVDFDAAVGEAPAPAPKVPALDKKKFAAPKATASATAPLGDDKPVVKTSDFTKLEADMRAGKYSSDDTEKQKVLTAKFEAEQARLNEAQRTGRVVRG